MGETLKLSIRLFLFTLIAALALAVTNEITKGPIAVQAEVKANAARAKSLPGADDYVHQDIKNPGNYSGIQEVHAVINGGKTVGYTLTIKVNGYKGPIVMTLAVNMSGSVNALVINSQTETAGLGNKIAGEPFLSQFAGVAASPDTISDEVDTISGATVSSRAVKTGVEHALEYVQNELGIVGKAGEVITEDKAALFSGLEDETGTKNVAGMNAYEAMGFPGIQNVFAGTFGDDSCLIIEFESCKVVVSDTGEVLSTTGSPTESERLIATDYALKYAGNGGIGK